MKHQLAFPIPGSRPDPLSSVRGSRPDPLSTYMTDLDLSEFVYPDCETYNASLGIIVREVAHFRHHATRTNASKQRFF